MYMVFVDLINAFDTVNRAFSGRYYRSLIYKTKYLTSLFPTPGNESCVLSDGEFSKFSTLLTAQKKKVGSWLQFLFTVLFYRQKILAYTIGDLSNDVRMLFRTNIGLFRHLRHFWELVSFVICSLLMMRHLLLNFYSFNKQSGVHCKHNRA